MGLHPKGRNFDTSFLMPKILACGVVPSRCLKVAFLHERPKSVALYQNLPAKPDSAISVLAKSIIDLMEDSAMFCHCSYGVRGTPPAAASLPARSAPPRHPRAAPQASRRGLRRRPRARRGSSARAAGSREGRVVRCNGGLITLVGGFGGGPRASRSPAVELDSQIQCVA